MAEDVKVQMKGVKKECHCGPECPGKTMKELCCQAKKKGDLKDAVEEAEKAG